MAFLFLEAPLGGLGDAGFYVKSFRDTKYLGEEL